MRLEDYFNFLAPDDIRIKGSRIGIETVLYDYIHRERTAEEIAKSYPTISLEQIYATILYYLHNKEQVSAYLGDWLEHGEWMREEQSRNPSPVMLKLRAIRETSEKEQALKAAPGKERALKMSE
jgi:uncharacterized protein (DUF433 family)